MKLRLDAFNFFERELKNIFFYCSMRRPFKEDCCKLKEESYLLEDDRPSFSVYPSMSEAYT